MLIVTSASLCGELMLPVFTLKVFEVKNRHKQSPRCWLGSFLSLFNVKSWSCPWLSVNQQEFKNRHLVILLSLFKSQGIFKLTGVQYHSQCERIELCSCKYLDFRGYHCWTLIIYLNVKSGGADKRTCWSKWHGSFCLILVLVLRRQLNWNNSKDTEALGITAGFMYREEIGFLLLCFGFPDKGRMKFLLSSQVVFSHRQNYKCIISFSLQYGQNCWGEVKNIRNTDVTKLDFAHFTLRHFSGTLQSS